MSDVGAHRGIKSLLKELEELEKLEELENNLRKSV